MTSPAGNSKVDLYRVIYYNLPTSEPDDSVLGLERISKGCSPEGEGGFHEQQLENRMATGDDGWFDGHADNGFGGSIDRL